MEGQDFDKALGRIISTLLALGMLAERASGACYPVRCLVLLLLRAAEAVAGNFVREVAQMPPGIADLPALPQDDSFTALLRLAMRFRTLAAVLGHMLGQPLRFRQDIRQARGGGTQLVVRHRNEGARALAEAGRRPGSRAPPFRFQQGRQSSLQSRNGCLERLGVATRQRRSTIRNS